MLGNILGSPTTEIILEGLQKPAWSIEYMPDLEWTTTPPTVADCDGGGWYWVLTRHGHIKIVEVEQWEDGKLHEYPANRLVEKSGYRCWLGPLPMPVPPDHR